MEVGRHVWSSAQDTKWWEQEDVSEGVCWVKHREEEAAGLSETGIPHLLYKLHDTLSMLMGAGVVSINVRWEIYFFVTNVHMVDKNNLFLHLCFAIDH